MSTGEGSKSVYYDSLQGKLYVAFGSQVWMSDDDGNNWRNLHFFGSRGKLSINHLTVQTIGSQRFLYVSSAGNGVWRKELGPNL